MPVNPSPSRLESFSDGVIAVIITIMVLEFKVPAGDGLAGFAGMLPTFTVYLISFVFTGIYWINHHHMVSRLKRVDALVLWANLGFLFTLSLMPFFTAYLVQKGIRPLSVALYGCSQLLDGISFTLLSKALIRHIRRSATVYDTREADEQAAENKKGFLSLAMYLTAIVVAFWAPWLALALIAAVTLVWVVPTFGVHPVADQRPPG